MIIDTDKIKNSNDLNKALIQLQTSAGSKKEKALVYLCYKLGATQSEVAEILEVSQSAVAQKYPKPKVKKSKKTKSKK